MNRIDLSQKSWLCTVAVGRGVAWRDKKPFLLSWILICNPNKHWRRSSKAVISKDESEFECSFDRIGWCSHHAVCLFTDRNLRHSVYHHWAAGSHVWLACRRRSHLPLLVHLPHPLHISVSFPVFTWIT